MQRCYDVTKGCQTVKHYIFKLTLNNSGKFTYRCFSYFLSLQKNDCQGTQKTLHKVDNCPENENNHLERSNTLQCDSYPSCEGEPLVYHCVRSNEEYVEVCSPRTKITGIYVFIIRIVLINVTANRILHSDIFVYWHADWYNAKLLCSVHILAFIDNKVRNY